MGTDAFVRPVEATQRGIITKANLESAASSTSAAVPKGQKNAAHGASRGVKSNCHTPHGLQRTDVITTFVKKAYAELHPTGVLLSLNVFRRHGMAAPG
mgnify:CR=1 FL=1